MTTPVADATKVLVGVGYIWTAPASTTAPDDPSELTASTFPTDWLTPWVYAGGTDAGVTTNFNPSTTDVTIEEQLTPALVVANKADYQITASLAQDTLDKMLLAYGRGATTITAPTISQVGKAVLQLADNTYNEVALGLEGVNTYGFPRRIYIPVAMSSAAVGTPYRRANKRLYPVTFRALCPLSQITITDYTATHS